jgi:hypothetical protein
VRALAANQPDALGLALKVASPVSALSAACNQLQRMLPTKHGHATLTRLQNAVQHAVDIVQRQIEIEETSTHTAPSQQHPSAMTTAETTREKEAASGSRDSSSDEPPDVRDDTNVGNALEALLSEARQQALVQRRAGRVGDAGQLSLAMGQAVGAALRARALKQHVIGRVPISHVDLAPLAKQVAVDICALTLEKHGVTPEVDIKGAAVACAQVTSASYILTEVLKNAIGEAVWMKGAFIIASGRQSLFSNSNMILRDNSAAATVKRHGIDSDWAPPVRITISDEQNDEHTEVVVHDDGGALAAFQRKVLACIVVASPQ